MTRYVSLALISFVAIAAAIAVPVTAQDPVRDFTLPPSETPTPTPTPVQGPVDDTGPVPVGPRPIATETPTPVATPIATPPAQPVATPQPAPAPTIQPTSQPAVQPTLAPSPTTNPETTSDETIVDAPADAPPPTDTAIPTQAPAPLPGFTLDGTTTGEDEQAWPMWLWLIAGLVGLITLAVAAWMAVRRRSSATTVPTIVPPIVPDSVPASVGASTEPNLVAGKRRFALDLEVISVMRSVMMVTVKARVTIANRTDRALRDVAISGDLTCASKTVPMEQQIAREGTQLASLTQVERIGPNKSHGVDVTLQIPIGEIDGFRQANIPMFVPLARICADCESADRVVKTYVLGVSAPGQKLHPLPLDGPPGGYQGIGSRALA